MAVQARTSAYLEKADRVLTWAEMAHGEMLAAGRIKSPEEVDRRFNSLLGLITQAHEACASAATVASANEWRKNLNARRSTDPLLLYLWKARNADMHGLIDFPNQFQHLSYRFVNAAKAAQAARVFYAWTHAANVRLMMFIFGAASQDELFEMLRSGATPDAEMMEAAGIAIVDGYASLALRSFTYRDRGKDIEMPAPKTHLGEPIPNAADVAGEAAIRFYRERAADLRARLLL